ncbi:MAG: hypothetical protein ACOY82_18930 [Pseudomonadota bacterium]
MADPDVVLESTRPSRIGACLVLRSAPSQGVRESGVRDGGHYFCPVCGWLGLEVRPVHPFDSYEICSCCGTEFGLDVSEKDDIEIVREDWLNEGAAWFSEEDRPADWNVERAQAQIRAYEDRKRRAS